MGFFLMKTRPLGSATSRQLDTTTVLLSSPPVVSCDITPDLLSSPYLLTNTFGGSRTGRTGAVELL